MRVRAQRRDRPVRLAVAQVDHGKARRHLRAGGALQPLVDLVLQQFGGLVEQVDGGQPVRQPPDHFVAAPADRRQFAKLVEHRERVDRLHVVALRAEKELGEQRGRRILALPRQFGIGLHPRRGLGRGQRVGIAAGFGVDLGQHVQRLQLDRVAAPGDRQRLELAQ